MGDQTKLQTDAKPKQKHSPKQVNGGKGPQHNHSKDQQPQQQQQKKGNVPTKEDLWKNAEVKVLTGNAGWIVEMTGLDSKTHTVYARAVQTADYKPSVHHTPSVRDVVDGVVDVAWKHVAKHILEAKSGANKDDEILRVDLDHWDQGAFPPANQLLQLGAVWLVNETSYLEQAGKKKHPHTKKKRLTSEDDGKQTPDWKDFVLRVHYAPNRFHAMEEVDWNKYCRGLLLGDNSVQVYLGGKLLAAHDHVPLSGYPDKKDGTIVYEDAEHGFVVLNKPGTVPDHATVNNHAEDVLTVFSRVLHVREDETKKEGKAKDHSKDPLYNHHHHRAAHLSLPLPLDTKTQGLIIISTKRAFGIYLTHMVEHPPKGQGVVKKYKCLVCVKKPEDMLVLNNLQESHATVTHYYHHNPNHKDHLNFVKAIPEKQHPHEYGTCQIRLVKIGTNHGLYAANVSSDTAVGDATLARRLWGLGVQNHSMTPAEDLGVSYVAQLELEQIVDAEQLHTHLNKSSRLTPQQIICGQLAALGFPVVGDSVHGGGTSEVWGHRHGWNRLALQCCEWSFPQPKWTKELEEVAASKEDKETTTDTAKKDDARPAKEEPPKEEAAAKEDEKKEEPKDVVNEAKPADEKEDSWTTVSNGKKSPKPTQSKHDNHKSGGGKTKLFASQEERCMFRLNEAWWNPLLDQYHVDGF